MTMLTVNNGIKGIKESDVLVGLTEIGAHV